MKAIEEIMRAAPVIPVLVIDELAHARPVAEALVAGGLKVLEVTLRTPAALEVIAEMKGVEGAIVGAGTVVDAPGLERAVAAGAEFIVSPGLSEALGRAAIATKIPFLPGVASAGDIMRALELGFEHLKFFPAQAAGGIPLLRALLGPFGDLRVCPTGGITAATMADWLAIDQVLCVGGSWLAKDPRDPDGIRRLAREACAAGQGV